MKAVQILIRDPLNRRARLAPLSLGALTFWRSASVTSAAFVLTVFQPKTAAGSERQDVSCFILFSSGKSSGGGGKKLLARDARGHHDFHDF